LLKVVLNSINPKPSYINYIVFVIYFNWNEQFNNEVGGQKWQLILV
jgi:hypothetical protein